MLLIFSLFMSFSCTEINSAGLRLAYFNCSSVNNSVNDIRELCASHDIVILQETWLLPYDITFLSSIHNDFLSFGNSAIDINEGFHVGRPFVDWRFFGVKH